MLKSLKELEIFVAVAENGSLTGAGRLMSVSTAAVSKCVTELEEELGVKLLVRTTHQIYLTEAGSTFYERCVAILTSLDDARNEIAQSSLHMGGKIRIHAPLCVGQMLLAPCLAEFMKAHPRVTLSLVLSPGPIQISRFELDLIIRSKSWNPGIGYSQRKLANISYAVCAAPTYLEKFGVPLNPADLERHNCLLHTTQEEADQWRFSNSGKKGTARVSGTFASNSSVAVRAAALAGVGVVRLPTYMVANEIASGSLISLFSGQIRSDRVVTAYYPRSNRAPANVQGLLDYLAANLGTTPAATEIPAELVVVRSDGASRAS
jgi:DNA-binding transcriptional LysR family regulator